MTTTPSKNELRARKKMKQLCDECKKPVIEWRSVEHLSRDLNAAAVAEIEHRKQRKQ
jgi:hypothetical protein